jgi:hypothetical protein
MPSPQKAKGSGYERDVAKFLTELYGETFIRAPGSGAYVGGKNQGRKEFLHEGQVRSFKGDIVPGQSFGKMNAECKFYKDFPFHLLLTGSCAQLDSWLDQLLDVEDEGDLNILFMKFNRIGQYVAVQPSLTWKMDNYTFYASSEYGDWLITEKESFFKNNAELVKTYSSTTSKSSDTKSNQILTINTEPFQMP